ncbi:MAG: amidohydrolase family protein [Candidatus Korarchaeota archaeon]|nr:amidohydrolase family protein [Candidatus Korarchaeota archaeon]NIU83737.1 amidohydrolase family protein [Candidatus Thorarchaeota archaeon]NIW15690.1 amidohydrolase family protein [Candidatus Thorarchaeota archaeon]NIW52054.1 amidohydrolase family protein [Candidatus Korarchaeota archaeon]
MNESINLNELSLVDEHCHPFEKKAKRMTKEDLLNLVLIGGHHPKDGRALQHAQESILYKVIIRELSKRLQVAGDAKEILAERNERAKDLKGYVKNLLDSIRTKGMIIDDGYSETQVEHALPKTNLEDFRKLIDSSIYFVHRIEPIILYAYKNSKSFDGFLSRIHDDFEEVSKKPRFRGFKTITAYRTGLNLTWREEEEAKEDYQTHKSEQGKKTWFGPLLRETREYIIRRVVEICAENGFVLQIHTGVGDKDIMLDTCNPRYLFKFLKREETRKAKITLVHGGYPYSSDAAWLTNAFSNVYMDLSVLVPFGVTSAVNKMKEVLSLAPASKVFYGSDGYSIPELQWIGGVLGKRSLAKALEEMMAEDLIDVDEAFHIARLILSKNAERVYNLE